MINMRGNPEARWPCERVDYVKVTRNGRVLDRNGNVVPPNWYDASERMHRASHHPDAHIPLSEWRNWKTGFEK